MGVPGGLTGAEGLGPVVGSGVGQETSVFEEITMGLIPSMKLLQPGGCFVHAVDSGQRSVERPEGLVGLQDRFAGEVLSAAELDMEITPLNFGGWPNIAQCCQQAALAIDDGDIWWWDLRWECVTGHRLFKIT